MMREGRFAAIAVRTSAGCTWKPSQMISAATSSVCRTAPTRPGRAMAERRHAVEQMRRVPRARRDRRERLVVGRAGVAERHAMPARAEPPDQVEPAVQLRTRASRCRRRARRARSRQGCRAAVKSFAAVPSRPSARRQSGHRAPREGLRRHAERLRAAVLGVDEVALEMRGQHARRARRRRLARRAHLIEHARAARPARTRPSSDRRR